MSKIPPDRIEATVPMLRDHVTLLKAKLAKLQSKIQAAESQLSWFERQAKAAVNGAGGRSKRGENVQTIWSWFRDNPGRAASLQEIATATGIALSSASRALEKLIEKDAVLRTEEGKYFKKDEEVF
jgi:DNA-binding MarR family transcriptional regulator